MKKILIIALIVLISFCSCGTEEQKESVENDVQSKFIGVWMNYNEISDVLSDVKNENDLIQKINHILDIFMEYKINNVFLHARAFDDAFYSSEIFIQSKYSYNADNEFIDFLSIFISCAHKKDIKMHAWINPYRISNQNDIEMIDKMSYAGKILAANPEDERIINCENGLYYNPVYTDIQNYIITGVREIIENYFVDGIHFDDYFYPTTDSAIDAAFYKEYMDSGGNFSLADLRRASVNSLILSVYSLCKQNNITFSISPSADIVENFYKNFASVEQWITDYGYIDLIIPQMYYGFQNETMPFDSCVEEWSKYNKNNKIILGLAVYKSGAVDEYALSGENEWIENSDIISRQIQMSNNNQFAGVAFYSASYLYKENNNAKNEKENIIKIVSDW